MRRLIGSLLAVSGLLSACTISPTTTRRPVATQSVKPTAKASVGAVASPSPTVSQKPTLLAGPTTRMAGKIAIDAYYIVAAKAGTLVSNNGGSSIALNAGTLISDNGLGLISNNGQSLISDNGLGLISNNGGGLVSNGSGTYRIRSEGGLTLGTILPVKGMAVFPISLRTGEIVGKPVFTDAGGQYALDVPEAVKGTIRVVARVPVAKADDPIARDPRLQYNLVAETGAEPQVLDEDSSIMSRYVRSCFSSRIRDLMVSTDPEETASKLVKTLGYDDKLKSFMMGTVLEVSKAGQSAGVAAMTPDEVEDLSQRATDVLLSYADVSRMMVDPVKYGKLGAPEPALAGLTDVIRILRDVATEKMKVDPEHYNALPLVKSANWSRTVKKPADLCDFFVDTCLLSVDSKLAKTKATLAELGVDELQAYRLNVISAGVLTETAKVLMSSSEAKAKVLESIASGAAAIKASKR